jgi:hypothetical protein
MSEFSFSFSRLNNYETCPFKYLKVDVQRAYSESRDQLEWGNKVHAALANSLKTGSRLPDGMEPWQKWPDAIRKMPGELLIEQKYALTRDLKPCEYFAPGVWMRSIADALKINGNRAGVFDWKTGAVKHNSVQLMLSTACVFAYHPEIEKIRTSFIWLKDGEVTHDDFTRDDIARAWPGVIERVAEMEAAAKTMNYPPKPGGLCKQYCPVQVCQFYQKGSPR